MRFSKSLLSLLLVIALLAVSVPLTAAAALPSYNAVEDYSEKQGTVWKYQRGYNVGGLYNFSDLEPNGGGGYGDMSTGTLALSSDDGVTGKPTINMHSGAKSDPVLTFVAPYSGTVEICMTNGGVYCPANGEAASNFDGINFYMCTGSTLAASFKAVSAKNTPANNRVFTETYTVEIVKGECIYFIVQPNENTANDGTRISPQIDYIKLSNKAAKSATVPAYIGTRVTSGPNSAVTADIQSNVPGTAADGVYKLTEEFAEYMDNWACFWVNGKTFNEMAWYNGTTWKGNSPATTATIGGGGANWHPYISGYTVARFTCPESGRVQVGSECKMSVNASTMDGVNVMVVSANNILGDTYLLNAENPEQDFEVLEFDVYKGQEIMFYLNMNVNNAGDSTKIAPYVKYVEYKDVEKPELTEEVYIEPRFDGTLKTDVEAVGTEETVGELNWNILQIVLCAAIPVVLAAAIFAVVLILKKKRGNAK